eukprot:4935608-Amphidinium_carterae.1
MQSGCKSRAPNAEEPQKNTVLLPLVRVEGLHRPYPEHKEGKNNRNKQTRITTTSTTPEQRQQQQQQQKQQQHATG